MKDDKELTYEQKHVALMESEVMALESIANALTQIAYTLSTNSTAVSALRTAVASAQQTVEAQAPVTPAPAPAPAQTPTPVTPAQSSEVTLDDLRNACLAATARNASAKNSIRALLTDRYQVANISKLDPSLYAQVKAEVDNL